MTHSLKNVSRRLLAAFCVAALTGVGVWQTTSRLHAFPQVDSDGDGIDDAFDNCPSLANVGQQDSDGNGTGNACQPVLAAVPWNGDPAKAHVVYSGGTLILQAVVWRAGAPGTSVQIASASWDPGDTFPPSPVQIVSAVGDYFNLELAHTYVGS